MQKNRRLLQTAFAARRKAPLALVLLALFVVRRLRSSLLGPLSAAAEAQRRYAAYAGLVGLTGDKN